MAREAGAARVLFVSCAPEIAHPHIVSPRPLRLSRVPNSRDRRVSRATLRATTSSPMYTDSVSSTELILPTMPVRIIPWLHPHLESSLT